MAKPGFWSRRDRLDAWRRASPSSCGTRNKRTGWAKPDGARSSCSRNLEWWRSMKRCMRASWHRRLRSRPRTQVGRRSNANPDPGAAADDSWRGAEGHVAPGIGAPGIGLRRDPTLLGSAYRTRRHRSEDGAAAGGHSKHPLHPPSRTVRRPARRNGARLGDVEPGHPLVTRYARTGSSDRAAVSWELLRPAGRAGAHGVQTRIGTDAEANRCRIRAVA